MRRTLQPLAQVFLQAVRQRATPSVCRSSQTFTIMQVVHAVLEDARAVAEIHVATCRIANASIVLTDYLSALSVEHREAMWRECIATGVPELLVAKGTGLAAHNLKSCGLLCSLMTASPSFKRPCLRHATHFKRYAS